MMMLTIPDGDFAGPCRINGKEAEFQLLGVTLSFRYQGETEWQQRQIFQRRPTMSPRRGDPEGKPVPCHTYLCADPGCTQDDYTIIG